MDCLIVVRVRMSVLASGTSILVQLNTRTKSIVIRFVCFRSDNCPVNTIKKGCFNDLRNPRPLPKLMFTDLDNSTAEFSGFPVDWGSWDGYLDDVVCRCAQVSKAKGFTYFGIENFGEYRPRYDICQKRLFRLVISVMNFGQILVNGECHFRWIN